MFIMVKNAQKEDILLNTDRIIYVTRQQDKDVFLHLTNGERFRINDADFEKIARRVGIEEF